MEKGRDKRTDTSTPDEVFARKDYIEREAFKAEVRRLSTHFLNEWDTLGVLAAAERIPAADVVPVRRGRWFLDGDYEYINCSECLCPFYMGFDTSSDARRYLARDDKWRFCPNCGARMDLKDGDEE